MNTTEKVASMNTSEKVASMNTPEKVASVYEHLRKSFVYEHFNYECALVVVNVAYTKRCCFFVFAEDDAERLHFLWTP